MFVCWWALRIRLGLLPLNGGVAVAREAFAKTDANSDGRINYDEFSLAFRNTLNTWLRREAEDVKR